MSHNHLPARGMPTAPTGVEVGRFDSYQIAQKAVDHLAESGFAVNNVTIVGTDLKVVERVIGRITYGRAGLSGFMTGSWFGLIIGFMLYAFSDVPGGPQTLIAVAVMGGSFGGIFGILRRSMTGGRRGFASATQIVASTYALLCNAPLAEEARAKLAQFRSN